MQLRDYLKSIYSHFIVCKQSGNVVFCTFSRERAEARRRNFLYPEDYEVKDLEEVKNV